jgi:putative SOS response-associated peptidase YedK
MCGRFQASSSPAELARCFKTTGPLPNVQQRYNAAPGQHLPIVLCGPETGKRRLVTLRWGLIPSWAGDVKVAYSMFNAMAETVATKPAFRDAFKSRRCLVPADAFYEWKKLDAETKQPYRFIIRDGSSTVLPRSSPITSTSPSSKAHQKSGPFAPPALPGLNARTTLSDSRQSRRLSRR